MRNSSSVIWAAQPGPAHLFLVLILPVMSILIGMDQLTKWLLPAIFPNTQVRISGGEYMIVQQFHLGKLLSTSNVLRIVILIILMGIGFYCLSRLWHMHRGYFAFGLVLGGCLSNLIDYARHGVAVEWISLRWWPAISLADVAVVIGGLLFLRMLIDRRTTAE